MTKNKPGTRHPHANDADILGPNTEIAKRLREYYNDIVSEDVPERFVELLSRLEKAEAERRLAANEEDDPGR
jgi:hypothetical protein